MGMKLGVMGGTFDPIDYGHLVTAEEALQQFELDSVVFVPTGSPWMKEHEVVSPARSLPDDRHRHGVQSPVPRVADGGGP